MISKHYSKMALVAVAAASLVFAGCGGKKDDATMDSHAGKGGAEVSANQDMNKGMNADSAAMDNNGAGNMVMKPSTNSVSFAFDSAAINDAGQMILGEYAAWLNANADVKVTVEGNGDERGSREYNLALGDKRANSVRDVLVANGVAKSRIDTVSFGEERPVCTQSGEACWAQNRRGDIVNR